jgi:hypothetical protein
MVYIIGGIEVPVTMRTTGLRNKKDRAAPGESLPDRLSI